MDNRALVQVLLALSWFHKYFHILRTYRGVHFCPWCDRHGVRHLTQHLLAKFGANENRTRVLMDLDNLPGAKVHGAYEIGDKSIGGFFLYLLRSPDLHHGPRVHDDDSIGDNPHLRLV